jgi:hypothetical protein
MKYKALTGLTYPATKADLELCLAGEPHARKELAEGETAEDIPAESVPWLLEGGLIKEVKARGDLRL